MDWISLAAIIAGIISNIGITVILASQQAAVIKRFNWLTERPALFRTMLASLGGIVSLVLAYFFLFDRAGTDGLTDVAGMLNANQGVLTLVGLMIAGMAVVVSVVGRESIAIEQRRQKTHQLHKRVRLVLDETLHNLVHVAQILGSEGERRATEVPQVSFRALNALLTDPAVEQLHDRVLRVGATVVRFHDYMHDKPVRNALRRSPRAIAVGAEPHGAPMRSVPPNLRRVMAAEAAEAEHQQEHELTVTVQRFALQCLGLVDAIDRHHHDAVCDELKPALRSGLIDALRRGRAGDHRFLSSDERVDGRELRAAGRSLLVWANDDPDEVRNVEVIEVGQIVHDMLGPDHRRQGWRVATRSHSTTRIP